MKPKTFDAIITLLPTSKFVVSRDGKIISSKLKNGETLPTESAIQTKLAELISDWDALEYARKRQVEYPDWGTQLNKIYDDGLTKWKSEMVDPIKAKYPKP